jgi:hypothetical protein
MCGGCGTRSDADWATPFLGSRPGRAAAAAVVAAAVERPVDVRAAPGGWTVRRPTGAQLVVGSLTALITALAPPADAVVPLPAAPGATLPGPDRRRPVVLVHGDAVGVAEAVDADAADWAERLMTGTSAAVVATGRHPQHVLHALLTDPLRLHVRITGLDGPTLPGWGHLSGRLAGVPDTVRPDQVPSLVALLALRLSGRPAGERTQTRVGAGEAAVVLDALGTTALAARIVRDRTEEDPPAPR